MNRKFENIEVNRYVPRNGFPPLPENTFVLGVKAIIPADPKPPLDLSVDTSRLPELWKR